MDNAHLAHPFLTAILHGDRAQLRQLRAELFPMVKSIVMKNGGAEDDVKDVFQETIMVVYDKAVQPDFVLTSLFSTFFYGIALNIWRGRRRKKANQEVTIPEDAPFIAEGQVEFDHGRLERQALFDKAFARLGEDCRELLGLFFQKISMLEIAERLGFGSENYARRRKHVCKERLIEMIRGYPEYHELREM